LQDLNFRPALFFFEISPSGIPHIQQPDNDILILPRELLLSPEFILRQEIHPLAIGLWSKGFLSDCSTASSIGVLSGVSNVHPFSFFHFF
jgi:hypothetical protein